MVTWPGARADHSSEIEIYLYFKGSQLGVTCSVQPMGEIEICGQPMGEIEIYLYFKGSQKGEGITK